MVKRYKVDYSKMVRTNTRVALFGESSHIRLAFTKEFITALRKLKTRGFTHLGLEMLPSEYNKKLKSYVHNGAHTNTLSNYFKKYWGSTERTINGYFEIIKVAKQLDMQIIGLDWLPEKIRIYDACFTKKIAKCKENTHLARNKHMASQIITHLANNAKMVVYTHFNHGITIPFNPTFPDNEVTGIGVIGLLRQKGQNTVFIRLVGGVKRFSGFSPKTVINAFKDKVANTRFYVKGLGGQLHPDFIVHSKKIP